MSRAPVAAIAIPHVGSDSGDGVWLLWPLLWLLLWLLRLLSAVVVVADVERKFKLFNT